MRSQKNDKRDFRMIILYDFKLRHYAADTTHNLVLFFARCASERVGGAGSQRFPAGILISWINFAVVERPH